MRLSVTSFFLCALLGLTGCDRTAPSAEQAQGSKDTATDTKAKKENFGLESASGMQATLRYEFAGQQAPDIPFTGADGRDVRLSDFSGRPLLVNIWATWCAPCKAEMPTLDALAAIEASEMSVIVISQDLQGRKPVRAFFDETGITNLEPYIDPENRISAAFDHQLSLPTTILYDSYGVEVWRVVGGVEWDDQEVARLLDEAA